MPDEETARDAGPGTPRRPPGALEAEVMDVLRAAGAPLSPGQVRERLAARQLEELSYSTVVTIVSRLTAKGLVARDATRRRLRSLPKRTRGRCEPVSYPGCRAGPPGCCASCPARTRTSRDERARLPAAAG